MRPGRPAKPAHLKLVEGNRGKRPIAEWVAPAKRGQALAPPAHLDPIAKAEWKRLAKEITLLGTLTNVDRAAFTAYCQCWSTYVQAQTAIDKRAKDPKTLGGLVMVTAAGNMIQDPLVGIRNTALRDLMRYASEFGFTPASRVRVQDAAPGAARQAAQAQESAAPARKFFAD